MKQQASTILPPVSPGSSAYLAYQQEKKNYASNPIQVSKSQNLATEGLNTIIEPNIRLLTNNFQTNNVTKSFEMAPNPNALYDSVVISKTVHNIPLFYDKNKKLSEEESRNIEKIFAGLPDQIDYKALSLVVDQLFELDKMYTIVVFEKILGIISKSEIDLQKIRDGTIKIPKQSLIK